MAQKLYEETNIQAIADAIRSKNGTTDTYTVADMADAILILDGGGAGGTDIYPDEMFQFSGDCQYLFARNNWTDFINIFGDRITVTGITDGQHMFEKSATLEEINFDLEFDTSKSYHDITYMFEDCVQLKKFPKLINWKPNKMSSIFGDCKMMRELPEFVNFDPTYFRISSNAKTQSTFNWCASLREIPSWWLDAMDGVSATTSYNFLNDGFQNCFTLNEIVGLPVFSNSSVTSNMFSSNAGPGSNCLRLKNLTFKTNEDGTPRVVGWKNQTMKMNSNMGYVLQASLVASHILGYNSGITADKEVKDDTTYQALKNDPDWFTTKIEYCRYNHDSAVATINSLPDTSAYIAANGGTNTITFDSAMGSKTDGGAVGALTEEEIAVATAKGWTVTMV